MSNETRKDATGDDEYQFPNDEYVMPSNEQQAAPSDSAESVSDSAQHQEQANTLDYTSAAQTTSAQEEVSSGLVMDRIKNIWNTSPIFKNKRIVAIVVAIVLVLVVFKFMQPSRQVITKTQTAAVVQKPTSQSNPQVMGQLNGLQQSAQSSQQEIRQLKSQVSALSGSLTQANANQVRMTQAVSMLAGQVKQLSTDLQKIRTKPVSKKKGPVGPRLVYVVKAVVPGRAWIINNVGGTSTVTIGDHVKQYGTVRSINPDTGVITTSSGKLIKYGSNDF